jgi:hypothetical protein
MFQKRQTLGDRIHKRANLAMAAFSTKNAQSYVDVRQNQTCSAAFACIFFAHVLQHILARAHMVQEGGGEGMHEQAV